MGYLNKSVKYIQTLKLEYTHLMSVGFRDRVSVTRSRSIFAANNRKKTLWHRGYIFHRVTPNANLFSL